MGGNYEEVNKEIEEAIMKYMTFVPSVTKESALSREESPMFIEVSAHVSTIVLVEET